MVCVLVGYNDRWVQPAPHRMAEFESQATTPSSFPLRWRSLRLLAILRDRLATLLASREATPLEDPPSPGGVVGDWCFGGMRLHFGDDGELRVLTRPSQTEATRLRWSEVDAGTIAIEVAKDRRQVLHWHRDGRRLDLSPADGSDGRIVLTVLDRAAPAGGENPWPRPAGGNDLESERQRLEQRLARNPGDLSARVDLIRVLIRSERPDQAKAQLDLLEQARSRDRNQASVEAVINGVFACGDHERALVLTQEALRHDPNDIQACVVATRIWWLRNAWPEVLTSAERGIAIPTTDKHALGFLLRMRGAARSVVHPDDGREAIQGLFAGYLEDGDENLAMLQFQRLTEERIQRAAAAMDHAAPGYQRIASLVDRFVAATTKTPAALDLHLREIVAACRRAGARPILLSYPESIPDVDRVLENVARDTGSLWVEMQPHFRGLLASRPRSELFIGDGHCTDGGYDAMALQVAQAVRIQMSTRRSDSHR
jgi:hypothetical protein